MKHKICLLGLLCLFLGIIPLQAKELIYIVKNYTELRAMPAFSFKAAPGFSGQSGTLFVGIGGLVADKRLDGAMTIGTGFGNPQKFLGGSMSITPGSLNMNGGFLEYGMASIEIGHTFTEHFLGLSMGMSQLTLWHGNNKNYIQNPSFYISASRFYNTPMLTALTVGIGNNMYADFNYINNNHATQEVGFFAAGAIYPIPQLSVIVDYTGGLTSLAFSLSPFPEYPINFNLGINGLFKELKDNKIDLLANASMSFAY